MEKSKIGAIFPIREEHFNNLLDNKIDVFIKFSNLNLCPDEKIIFYLSKKGVLIGQAKIVDVKELDPEEAWLKYGDRMFLDHNDYKRYTEKSPITGQKRKRKLKIITLTEKSQYFEPVKPTFTITAAGRYLSETMFNKIGHNLEVK